MNTNVKDRLRCAYEDCAEAHPLANESTYEQVTCLTCRATLGLPPIEIYKNSGATIAATPKPRAGEHTPTSAELVASVLSLISEDIRVAAALDIEAAIKLRLLAERNSLRERERELVEALEKIASCHSAFDGDVVSTAYKALAKVQLKKLKDAP